MHQGTTQKTNNIHETSQNPESFNLANNVHIDEHSNYNIENDCITSAQCEEIHDISLNPNNEFITNNHSIQFNSSVHINHDFNTCSQSEQELYAVVHTSTLLLSSHTFNEDNVYSNSLVLDEYSYKCLMCENGDLPTGMHRYRLCISHFFIFLYLSIAFVWLLSTCESNRRRLWGSYFWNVTTNKSIDLENKTTENWKGQTPKVSQPKKVQLNHISTSSQLLSM